MQIDERLIDHLANLARLEFNQAEKLTMIKDMQKIIGFVEKLNELDTSGVVPARFMGVERNVVRQDMPGGMLQQEEALAPAPHHNESFFMVPKVIRRES